MKGTAFTRYVKTCKGHLTDQVISLEKSEALHSPAMLKHAKVIWLIRTSLLRNKRHCTHPLCWKMQRPLEWLGQPSWEIRGTALTHYVGKCKDHLTSLQRNQRHCTHNLCWNMQRSFDWSGHPTWEIRGTALTSYIRTYKGHLTDQNIPPEK